MVEYEFEKLAAMVRFHLSTFYSFGGMVDALDLKSSSDKEYRFKSDNEHFF